MEIYLITNIITKKRYVGKTKLNKDIRLKQHIKEAFQKEGQTLHKAIRKYGPNNFIVEQLDIAKTDSELERYWIKKLRTYPKEYNMTPGGDGRGHKLSKKTIEKIRQKSLNRTLEQKDKYRASQLGRKYGIETKEKHRQKMLGNQYAVGMTYLHTEEAKRKISEFNLGLKKPKWVGQKVSKNRKGKGIGLNNAMANPENRLKVSQSKLGRHIIIYPDGSRHLSPRIQ